MQANWNAALEPEVVGDNHLRNTSFEQRAAEKDNPLRCGLEGYCPVQLQDHDRWIAGNPDFQMSYQGQVFRFSSEAARKRFEAAPEKYAPVTERQRRGLGRGREPHRARQRESLRRVARAAILVLQLGNAGHLPAGPGSYANGSRQTAHLQDSRGLAVNGLMDLGLVAG